MTTDIIMTWPDNCDYPLWRRFIQFNRRAFNQVIIVLMKTNSGVHYGNFIKTVLDNDCIVVDSPVVEAGQDWRNVAVNYALSMSMAKLIWFTEQDFIIHEGFWDEVNSQFAEGCKVVSVYDQYRMHPCCIFAERSVINETRKDFGIVPNKSDHFSLFQEDIDEMFYEQGLKIGTIDKHFEHLNGLSSNFYLISNGQEPNYKPERFKKYIEDTLASGMLMHPDFIKVCNSYLDRYKTK